MVIFAFCTSKLISAFLKPLPKRLLFPITPLTNKFANFQGISCIEGETELENEVVSQNLLYAYIYQEIGILETEFQQNTGQILICI